jgi:hypothetical protein
MRTLFEIVEGARDGQKPTHDECYFAMLALGYLLGMDHRDLREACTGASELKKRLMMNSSFDRYKKALDADPEKWLGPTGTPGTLENTQIRKMAFGVLKKVLGDTDTSGPK